ncbi:unnamed protein product [Euphydryas editha]|uniref:Chitin-binding type-2 domain-containing protein n=1 Tax=Euphydryas editha TaxID=104508 RepID=A0AAU9TQB5_EUPED|nr:unnamed protein product [Euphydryas editha]
MNVRTESYFTIPWINAQGERNQRPFDNGHGWDIRLAVPGLPGNDYPTLSSIPRTTFTCSGKDPGYYADIETNCQVFRVCTLGSTYGFQSFLCPNGTLFNQEFFVCDWWMNVNCQKSTELFNNRNEKFTNLKLGPQFMTNIKKMITHPIRNPYNKSQIKSNILFMQVYKPPLGQLYNEALLRHFERNTNDIYVNKKPTLKAQPDFSKTDITFAASTPTSQYVPNNIFQNQIQNSPFSKFKGLSSNVHGGQTSRLKNQNTLYNSNIETNYSPFPSNTNAQLNTFNSTYRTKNSQALFGVESSKQRLNQNFKKEQQFYTTRPTQARFSKDNVGQLDTETKQNLVSKDTPPALITKTLAFRKIIKDPKNGTPKSRITFKTWIVRPSKAAKLTAEITPYINAIPNNYIDKTTKDETVHSVKDNNQSYKYDPPKILNNEIKSTLETISDHITTTTSSSVSPTYSTTFLPTTESPFYLAPTTFNPLPFSYLPPKVNAEILSRQYLLPNIANDELVAAGSSPSPFLKVPAEKYTDGPKFSLSKQSIVNSNNNNLSFSDILTREKLDISVNDIVKDTNDILQTDSPKQLTQLNQNTETIDYPTDNYLPPDSSQQSDERLTLQPPSPLPQSSRLIDTPSTKLEPPNLQFPNTFKISNKFSNLPYIKETPLQPSTIERMVSLKITIPETLANYLFKNRNDNDSTNIEILNTANNNYLVLTNKQAENSDTNLIPLGKLIKNKTTNISDSQDLLFSYLADSINAAQQYNNIAQESLLVSTPTQQQFKNLQNEQLQQISQDISGLTSSQFTGSKTSGHYLSSNIVRPHKPESNSLSKIRENQNIISNFTVTQKQQYLTPQNNVPSSQNQIKVDNIYSGQLYQLPVPVVTKQIYNSPHPSISNYILSGNLFPTNSYINPKQTNDKINSNEVEIIPSHSIPISDFQTTTSQKNSPAEQGIADNYLINHFKIPANSIRAQIRDNIVGTIPHPLDENKLIRYKKDQSYDIYTHLNNNYVNSYDNLNGKTRDTIDLSSQVVNSNPSFQLVPSLGYKLEDENEKQNILNVFHIDEFGSPKQNTFFISQKSADIKRRQDISTDVDFTVNHSTSSNNVNNARDVSTLYDGPSSYSAPQASVGSLESNYQSDSRFNANIEKFDTLDDTIGYPKVTPSKKFIF